MPDDEVVMVEGVEVTVVEETSSSGSTALIGASTIGGEGEVVVSGPGGHPDFGAVGGASGIVVDGSTGEVLGTATVNPDTGVVEQSGVEVTVVEETSSSSESGASGALAGSSAVEEEDSAPVGSSGGVVEVQTGDAPRPDGPFWIFRRVVGDSRRVVTDCTTVAVAFRTLVGTRTVHFRIFFEGFTRSPNGPRQLGEHADVASKRTLEMLHDELVILMSLPPISFAGSVESVTDAVIAPIAAQLFGSTMEDEFRKAFPDSRIRAHSC